MKNGIQFSHPKTPLSQALLKKSQLKCNGSIMVVLNKGRTVLHTCTAIKKFKFHPYFVYLPTMKFIYSAVKIGPIFLHYCTLSMCYHTSFSVMKIYSLYRSESFHPSLLVASLSLLLANKGEKIAREISITSAYYIMQMVPYV